MNCKSNISHDSIGESCLPNFPNQNQHINPLWIQTLSEKVQLTLQIIPQSHFLRRYDWIHRDHVNHNTFLKDVASPKLIMDPQPLTSWTPCSCSWGMLHSATDDGAHQFFGTSDPTGLVEGKTVPGNRALDFFSVCQQIWNRIKPRSLPEPGSILIWPNVEFNGYTGSNVAQNTTHMSLKNQVPNSNYSSIQYPSLKTAKNNDVSSLICLYILIIMDRYIYICVCLCVISIIYIYNYIYKYI